ncbi:Crp/Fnr family transcriptional regulator [bacterium]|nr:Crp/Fnr family transcriptional regulator [bacterium]
MDIMLLKTVPLFSDLPDRDLERVVSFMVTKRYKKHNLIFFEDDLGQNLFIIKKGRVKISRLDETGGEVIFAIMGEGDFFGELSIIDGQTRSATVTSIEDVELLVLWRGDFLDILQKYPQIAITLLKELASRIRKSDSQIKSLSLKDAKGRVASTLMRLAEDIGIIQDGEVVIKRLPLQKDLANISGTSRETISRVIKKLEAGGYFEKKKNSLRFLDYEKFKKDFS